MRLFILDPAVTDFSGHHFAFNLALLEACRRRGLEARILGNAACTPAVQDALGVVRCFDFGTYTCPPVPELDMAAAIHFLHNAAFEQNLRSFAPTEFDEDDVVLAHTATSDQIVGLLRWYRRLSHPRPRVAMQFMFPPWFQRPERDRALMIVLQRRAMAAWREDPDNRAAFFSDSAVLGRYLEDLAEMPVRHLPMPIIFPPEEAPAAREGGPLTFVYLGEPRLEKGFGVLVRALVENRTRSELPVRFAIQTSGLPDQGLVDALRQALPHDILVTEAVSDQAYWRLLSAADGVLLPYDPAVYALRSSRILVEAVGLGKPVLVTGGCWLDAELGHLGGAGVRVDYDPPSVWRGIERLTRDHVALTEGARAAAPACRRRNSPDGFLDALLGPGRP